MSSVADQRGKGQNGNGKLLGGVTGKGFMPGQSGNPTGRPTAGATVREWYNQMQGLTVAELQAINADSAAPVAKVAAANQWLRGIINGTELDRVLDRTDGKPTQNVNVNGEMNHRLEAQAKLRKVLNDPEAVDAAGVIADRLYGNDGADRN
jgi:hypothetical protein